MAQQPQVLDLSTLSLEQLNMLKQQFEEELQMLSNSYQQLKMVSGKYRESKQCLNTLTKEQKGKQILIPFTSSLYVPGSLNNVESVLVDIGTGYYVKKTIPNAIAFTDRKIKLVEENADKVQQALVVKRKNLETVLIVMQQKIQILEAQQQR